MLSASSTASIDSDGILPSWAEALGPCLVRPSVGFDDLLELAEKRNAGLKLLYLLSGRAGGTRTRDRRIMSPLL
jgi:hypothetical protein